MSSTRSNSLSIVLLLLFFSYSELIYSVSSESNNKYNTPIINIDFLEGHTIDKETTISAEIIYADNINSVSWELVDSSGSRGFFDITDDLLFLSSGGANISNFHINIDPYSIGPCSCVIVVSLTIEGGEPIIFSRSIFIESPSFPDWIAGPTLKIHNTPNSWASGAVEIFGISSTYSGNDAELYFSITNSNGVNCLDEEIEDFTSVEHERIYEISWSSGTFTTNISFSHLEDGPYQLTMFSNDTQTGLFADDCIPIKVDNTEPDAIINGENTVFESDDLLYFSGSSTTDFPWGIEGMTYVWSVSRISDVSIENIVVYSGQNPLSPGIQSNYSGVYQVSLNVVDRAGNRGSDTFSFEIKNMQPEARLLINSEEVSNGNELQMDKNSIISIDASLSYDTENDRESLRYVWRINNVPLYEGVSREINWPETDSDRFLLSLEVVDDDSETSIISVLVVDSENTSSPIFTIILFFSAAIFLSYAANKHRNTDTQSDIPKWK